MIYFITARDVGRVKIGYTQCDVQQRFHVIQAHSPVPLALECVCDGHSKEEGQLHSQFSAAHVRGEWFDLSPEIEAHMAGLERYEWRHRGWHHAVRRAQRAEAA